MTPPINPAFAKYVTHIVPELPKHLVANKYKIVNLESGKTTNGAERQRSSRYTRKGSRKIEL